MYVNADRRTLRPWSVRAFDFAKGSQLPPMTLTFCKPIPATFLTPLAHSRCRSLLEHAVVDIFCVVGVTGTFKS